MSQTEAKALVVAAIDQIRELHANAPLDRALLARTAQIVEGLAQRRDVFSLETYPLAENESELSIRYLLHADADQSLGLYLIAQRPGRTSLPHNHKTWAVIASVQGQEINRLYRRLDDGRDADLAQLEIDRVLVVEPGRVAGYLPEDIHSIHVEGQQPTLHFHLYGRALETLTEREAFDLETGRVARYNQTQWVPSVVR